MTNEERIAKAKKNLDFMWGEFEFWLEKEGEDSLHTALWIARWVAAKDMYNLLSGDNYISRETHGSQGFIH